MNTEEFYLSRVEPPQWFKAPSNIDAFCDECGKPIRPGDLIRQIDDAGNDYIHQDCLTSQIEDQMGDCQ